MSDDIDPALIPTLEAIDEQIEEINNHKVMRAAQKMIARREKLQSARRALLGAGSKLTSSGGKRITQQEVVLYLKSNQGKKGLTAVELAESMGYPESTIRSQLNRGKGDVFVQDDSKRWKARDPEEDED